MNGSIKKINPGLVGTLNRMTAQTEKADTGCKAKQKSSAKKGRK